jgi:mannose-1-phosphate guanylyltransferase/mannose-6-phosphate isomerase
VSQAAAPIVPVIMCGGAGTRLWPLSTQAAPKPFHVLSGERTLFQDTVLRVTGEHPARFLAPLIVCGAAHWRLVEDQLAAIGAQADAIVLEPVGRGTAPAAAIAAQLVSERHPDALILLLSADHMIADPAGFRAVVAKAAVAATGHIVTFGIAPSRPEPGYGYIQQGAPLVPGVFEVARFVEKPDAATAQAWLDEGGYLWNAGIFLYSPAMLLAELSASRPDIAEAALAALPTRSSVIALDEAAFRACPAESIDRAVMEVTRRAAVAPCEVAWADIGSWSELWRLGAKDADGNVVHGPVAAAETAGSIIWSDGPVVATLGVDDLIVVATRDAVLVLPKSRAQEVKSIVERLNRNPSPSG